MIRSRRRLRAGSERRRARAQSAVEPGGLLGGESRGAVLGCNSGVVIGGVLEEIEDVFEAQADT